MLRSPGFKKLTRNPPLTESACPGLPLMANTDKLGLTRIDLTDSVDDSVLTPKL